MRLFESIHVEKDCTDGFVLILVRRVVQIFAPFCQHARRDVHMRAHRTLFALYSHTRARTHAVQVGGARPQHRLAHTTCFMELPEGEGGNRAVVFGGAGCVYLRVCVYSA